MALEEARVKAEKDYKEYKKAADDAYLDYKKKVDDAYGDYKSKTTVETNNIKSYYQESNKAMDDWLNCMLGNLSE
jgi:hypothetical protein